MFEEINKDLTGSDINGFATFISILHIKKVPYKKPSILLLCHFPCHRNISKYYFIMKKEAYNEQNTKLTTL